MVEQVARAEKEAWRRLAFIGWQINGEGTFAEYLARLGLGEQPEPLDVQAEKEKALAAAERVLTQLRERGWREADGRADAAESGHRQQRPGRAG